MITEFEILREKLLLCIEMAFFNLTTNKMDPDKKTGCNTRLLCTMKEITYTTCIAMTIDPSQLLSIAGCHSHLRRQCPLNVALCNYDYQTLHAKSCNHLTQMSTHGCTVMYLQLTTFLSSSNIIENDCSETFSYGNFLNASVCWPSRTSYIWSNVTTATDREQEVQKTYKD